MFDSIKFKIFFPVLLLSYGSKTYAQLPTVCNSEFKDKVLPYIQELEKIGPLKLIQRIKGSKSSDLIDYHMSYGLNIRNQWFYGKESKVELMKMYNAAGIKHVDDMSQDLIEGVWAKGSIERCQILGKEHALTKKDLGQVEKTSNDKTKK